MNNLKVVISCFCVCLCMFIGIDNTLAQNGSTVDSLNNNNKEWYMQFPSKKDYTATIIFSKTEYVQTFTYDGDIFEERFPYYLSDYPEQVFDQNKVGNASDGNILLLT